MNSEFPKKAEAVLSAEEAGAAPSGNTTRRIESIALRRVLGSFRILARRSAELGHPGLSVWTDCGLRAAAALADELAEAKAASSSAPILEGHLDELTSALRLAIENMPPDLLTKLCAALAEVETSTKGQS